MADPSTDRASTVLLITGEGMGQADLPLRHKLLRIYLTMLLENDDLPLALCFYTEGVRLVVEGSPVLDELKALEGRGVRLILCQTCLNYFQLADKVRVGIVGGMGDILAAQGKAAKVITL
jgi:hypothetical protein